MITDRSINEEICKMNGTMNLESHTESENDVTYVGKSIPFPKSDIESIIRVEDGNNSNSVEEVFQVFKESKSGSSESNQNHVERFEGETQLHSENASRETPDNHDSDAASKESERTENNYQDSENTNECDSEERFNNEEPLEENQSSDVEMEEPNLELVTKKPETFNFIHNTNENDIEMDEHDSNEYINKTPESCCLEDETMKSSTDVDINETSCNEFDANNCSNGETITEDQDVQLDKNNRNGREFVNSPQSDTTDYHKSDEVPVGFINDNSIHTDDSKISDTVDVKVNLPLESDVSERVSSENGESSSSVTEISVKFINDSKIKPDLNIAETDPECDKETSIEESVSSDVNMDENQCTENDNVTPEFRSSNEHRDNLTQYKNIDKDKIADGFRLREVDVSPVIDKIDDSNDVSLEPHEECMQAQDSKDLVTTCLNDSTYSTATPDYENTSQNDILSEKVSTDVRICDDVPSVEMNESTTPLENLNVDQSIDNSKLKIDNQDVSYSLEREHKLTKTTCGTLSTLGFVKDVQNTENKLILLSDDSKVLNSKIDEELSSIAKKPGLSISLLRQKNEENTTNCNEIMETSYSCSSSETEGKAQQSDDDVAYNSKYNDLNKEWLINKKCTSFEDLDIEEIKSPDNKHNSKEKQDEGGGIFSLGPDVTITVVPPNMEKSENKVSTEKQNFSCAQEYFQNSENDCLPYAECSMESNKSLVQKSRKINLLKINTNIKSAAPRKPNETVKSECSAVASLQKKHSNYKSFLDTQSKRFPTTFSSETVQNSKSGARKLFLCSSCNSYFENWNLFLHMRDDHQRYICLHCLGMFSQPEKLSQHLQTKHNVKDKAFNSLHEFELSQKSSYYLVCCSCDKMFTEKDDFYNHSCSSVLLEKMEECSLCGLIGAHFPTCRRALTDNYAEFVRFKSHPAFGKKSIKPLIKSVISDDKPEEFEESQSKEIPESIEEEVSESVKLNIPETKNEEISEKKKEELIENKIKQILENNLKELEEEAKLRELIRSMKRESLESVKKEMSENKKVCEVEENKKMNEVEEYKKINEVEENKKMNKVEENTKMCEIEENKKMYEIEDDNKKVYEIEENNKMNKVEENKKMHEVEENKKMYKGEENKKMYKVEENKKMCKVEENKKIYEVEEIKETIPLPTAHGSDSTWKVTELPTTKPMQENEPLPSIPKLRISTQDLNKIIIKLNGDQMYSELSSSRSKDKSFYINRVSKNQDKVTSSLQSIEDSINRVLEQTADDGINCEERSTKQSQRIRPSSEEKIRSPKQEDTPMDCTSEGSTASEDINSFSQETSKDNTSLNTEEIHEKTEPINLKNEDKEVNNVSDDESSDSEKLTIALETHGDPVVQESATDDVPTAGSETPYIDLYLTDEPSHMKVNVLIKELVKVSCWNCVYCSHAKRIAVNGKQLALHLISEHRFMLKTFEGDMWTVISNILKENLSNLDRIYLNVDTFDSSDSSVWQPNERIYECFHCLFATYIHKELYSHNKKMHQTTVFLCIMCKSNFYNYSEMLCHLCTGIYIPGQVINPEIKFRCYICNVEPLPSSFRLMVHLRKSHNSCDICFDVSADQFQLSTHVWKHKLSHMCYRCGIAYRNKPDITKHMFWKHGTESVLCKKCLQKKWPHVYHFCVPPNVFKCEECNSGFSRAVALRVHKRTHLQEFPYSCDSCDEKFISKRILFKHKEKHEEGEEVLNVTNTSTEEKMEVDESLKENCHSLEEKIVVEDPAPGKSKEKKSKKKSNVTDVFDLPPVNLSESDDSDEDLPKHSLHDSVTSDTMRINGAVIKEEKDETPQVVDGIWDDFQSYLVSKEPNSPKPKLTKRMELIMLSDHDYNQTLNILGTLPSTSAIRENAFSEKSARADHDYCDLFLKKEPPSPTKSKKSKGSSDSSSDSGSSCTCGSNCSCSSDSSSSSSSSSSSDSTGSHGKKKTTTKKKMLKKKKLETTTEEPPPTHNTTTHAATPPKEDINIQHIPPVNHIRESDLDTDETETDEDFYDYNPARMANKVLAEKRKELLACLNNEFDQLESSPAAPVEKVSPIKKKLKTRKKRSQGRANNSRVRHNKVKTKTNGFPYFEVAPETNDTLVPEHNFHQLPESAMSLATRMFDEDATHSSGESEGKRPKRKRIPLKFYGFSSDEDTDTPPPSQKKRERIEVNRTIPAEPTTFSNSLYQKPADTWNIQPASTPLQWRIEKKDPIPQEPKVHPIKIRTSQIKSRQTSPFSIEPSVVTNEVYKIAKPEPVLNRLDINGSTAAQRGEKVYCFCQCPYDEVSEMIACDADDCKIEWFHFECVGIMVPPKGKWFCPECRKKQAAESEFMPSLEQTFT